MPTIFCNEEMTFFALAPQTKGTRSKLSVNIPSQASVFFLALSFGNNPAPVSWVTTTSLSQLRLPARGLQLSVPPRSKVPRKAFIYTFPQCNQKKSYSARTPSSVAPQQSILPSTFRAFQPPSLQLIQILPPRPPSLPLLQVIFSMKNVPVACCLHLTPF